MVPAPEEVEPASEALPVDPDEAEVRRASDRGAELLARVAAVVGLEVVVVEAAGLLDEAIEVGEEAVRPVFEVVDWVPPTAAEVPETPEEACIEPAWTEPPAREPEVEPKSSEVPDPDPVPAAFPPWVEVP